MLLPLPSSCASHSAELFAKLCAIPDYVVTDTLVLAWRRNPLGDVFVADAFVMRTVVVDEVPGEV